SDVRQEIEGPVEAATPHLLEEHVREDERDDDLDRHGDERVGERDREGVPELLGPRTEQDGLVVVQAPEGAGDDVPLEQRHDHCGHVFSAVQSYTDATLEKCPSCGKRPRKLMATPAIVFKGGGWYKTDSRPAQKDAPKDAAPDAKAEGKPKDASPKAADAKTAE